MAFNLVDLIKQQLNDSTIDNLSNRLGESKQNTERAISGAIPGVLAGLLSRHNDSSTDSGNLLDVISRADTKLLDNHDAIFSNQADVTKQGNTLLDGVLGNGMLSKLAGAIASFSGIGRGSSSSLLAMLSPVIFGAIKRQLGTMSGGLSLSNLSSMLAGQRDNIRSAMPDGLQNHLNDAGLNAFAALSGDSKQPVTSDSTVSKTTRVTTPTTTRTTTRTAPEPDGGSPLSWLLPLVLVAGLGLLAWNFFNNRNTPTPDTNTTTNRAVDDTARTVVTETETAGQAVEEAAQNAANATSDAVRDAANATEDVARDAGNAINNAANATGDAVRDAANATEDVARDAANAAGNAINNAANATGDAVRDATNATEDVARDAANAAGNAINNAANATGDAVRDAANATEDVARDAANATGNAINNAANATGDAVRDAANATEGAARDAANATGNAINNAANATEGAAQNAADTANDAVNNTITTTTTTTTGNVRGMSLIEVSQRVTDSISQATESLSNIRDDASAEAAVGELESITTTLRDVRPAFDGLSNTGRAQISQLANTSADTIQATVDNIDVEGVQDTIGAAVQQLIETLRNFGN